MIVVVVVATAVVAVAALVVATCQSHLNSWIIEVEHQSLGNSSANSVVAMSDTY